MTAQNIQTGSQVIGPTAAAAMGDVIDAGNYRHLAFTISGLTVETIGISGGLEANGILASTNYSAALRPVDGATGAVTASSLLGNGSYIVRDWPYFTARFTKSAGAESTTIRVIKVA